jgi:hypothetical protein
MLALLVLSASFAFAGDNALHFNEPVITLWPNGAPGSPAVIPAEEWNPVTDGIHRVRNIHSPSITVFLPPKDKANGAAFIICPGGGHNYLVMDLEGANVAHRLNEMGIAGFVLKSRLAHTAGYNYRVDVESLQDAQRAIRTVRSRAAEWNLNPEKVGIMGFSAGGRNCFTGRNTLRCRKAGLGRPGRTRQFTSRRCRSGLPRSQAVHDAHRKRYPADSPGGEQRRQSRAGIRRILSRASESEGASRAPDLQPRRPWFRDDWPQRGIRVASGLDMAGSPA